MDNCILLNNGKQHLPLDDDNCLPECLLPLQPVTDCYSSDHSSVEDKCQQHVKRLHQSLSSSNFTNVSHNGSDINLQMLEKYFNVLLYPLPKGPKFEDIQNISVTEIMTNIMLFVTNRKESDINCKTMIDELLKLPERGFNILNDDKDFQINLRESTTVPTCQKMSSTNYLLACNFVDKMVDTLLASIEINPVHSENQHATVKSCMKAFCALTSGKVMEKGACVHTLQSKECGAAKKPILFKAQPDLILQYAVESESFPGIPFDVFSQLKKQEEKRTKINLSKHTVKKLKPSDITSDTTDNMKLKVESQHMSSKSMASIVPIFTWEKSNQCESSFKDKLVAQHILQIIAVASEYCYYKLYVTGGQMQKSKVFIAFLVCDEYVYITKVQGDEACFANFKPGPTIQPRFRSVVDRVKQLAAGRPEPKIHVQFSSIVLDLSIHNHRMALLFFIQYWMTNWNEIKTEVISKDEKACS